MVERDCPPARHGALPAAGATRRRLISVAATLLVLPVVPRLAQAATILAVRTWPADEYTRVTLELDSELKAEQFTLENPHRLVVDIEGLTLSAALNDLVSKVRPDDPYIQSLRVAQNRPNVVRLVFDLKQAVAPQVFTLKPVADYQYRLVLDLYPKIAQDPLVAIPTPTIHWRASSRTSSAIRPPAPTRPNRPACAASSRPRRCRCRSRRPPLPAVASNAC